MGVGGTTMVVLALAPRIRIPMLRPGPAFLARLVPGVILLLLAACGEGAPDPAGPAALPPAGPPPAAPRLELRPGDSIAIVGNGLAEQMQHDGWFETLLHVRFPDHALVVRNLAVAGDEVSLRPRSKNFGTPDEHLQRCKADVVIAFFGRNEAFAGPAGLDRFRADLTGWLRHVRGQTFGQAPPRVVLCGPLQQEALPDPALPQGEVLDAINQDLRRYSDAMAAVARAEGVPFVDLGGPPPMAQRNGAPWTSDGVRPTAAGNHQIAVRLDAALFGGAEPASPHRDAIRAGVLEKNDLWFHRYRTTDGYSIFGDRGELAFVDGQTNREVLNRELEVLDQMTRNRDRLIHARARGQEIADLDRDLPPFLPVKTNIPGPLPDGAHRFQTGEAAIADMTVLDGLQVNLFASEERFPALVNPNQMAVDPRGRVWVTAWPTYPHWQPRQPRNDKLLILPDDDGDGRADRCIEFASDLHNPTGFDFWNGGVLVAQVPDLWFLQDTDGDDVADRRERVLSGLDSADTHHSINSFVFSPGGILYFQEGTFHHTGVETPWSGAVRSFNAGVFAFDPRSRRFEVHAAYPFANPHGHVVDRWGQGFVTDGTGAVPYWGTSISVHVEHPRKLGGAPTVYRQRTRPCPGTAILSSSHFPPSMQGEWLVANVIGVLGVLRYRLHDDGAGYTATEQPPLLTSRDPNFRPADVDIGGDGAIYLADWHNPIIGHMQHNLRDPSRDKAHGRVYRVTVADRAPRQAPDTSKAGEGELVALLADPDEPVRYRARAELSARPTAAVLAAVAAWLPSALAAEQAGVHPRLEALWLQQRCGAVDEALLATVLADADPRARAAAVKVLVETRHGRQDLLERLRPLVADPHPRVRAEAVRGCSFVPSAQAAEVALGAAAQPLDRWLTYILRETLKTLEPRWREAIRLGAFAPPAAGLAWLLDMVETADLVQLPKTDEVCEALLQRAGVPAAARRDALRVLAERQGRTPLLELLARLQALPASAPAAADLGALLLGEDEAALRAEAAAIEALGRGAAQPAVRAACHAVALRLAADPAPVWDAAAGDGRLGDLLAGVALGRGLAAPDAVWERVQPLLRQADGAAAPTPGVAFQLYRAPAFPDVRQETLSALTPVATGVVPHFTQQVPGADFEPYGLQLRATLHVPNDGRYTLFVASDDGSRLYLDGQELIQNDGPHGIVEKRAARDLTAGPHDLLVTWSDHGGADHLTVSWAGPDLGKQPIPASALTVNDPLGQRRAAIAAAAVLAPGRPAAVTELTALLAEPALRGAALAALRRLDCEHLPPELARPLLAALQALLPGADEDAIALGLRVCRAVPESEAAPLREAFGRLEPQRIELRTLPERMRYDKEQFTVRAGRPVRLRLQNPDAMMHNLLIVQPGALEAIGTLAEALGQDGFAKDFVPADPRVLHHTKLLQPGASEVLEFTAPGVPGDYPYVCTFPGHWRIMQGVMHVVP